METVLFALFLIQYKTIVETLSQMKPFLNINEETGHCCYRLIFVLKILFVVFGFDRFLQKSLSPILKQFESFCGECKNPIWRDIIPISLSGIVICFSYTKPLLFISGEFLIDIFMLLLSFKYAVEAYKELHKISLILFLCLFIQWSINSSINLQQFTLTIYFQVLSLLFLSYFSMIPDNLKFKRNLNYMYIFMYVWVFYRLGQEYYKHDSVANHNKGIMNEGQQTMLEHESRKLDDVILDIHLDAHSENIPQSQGKHFEEIEKRESHLNKEVPGEMKMNFPTQANPKTVGDKVVAEKVEASGNELDKHEGSNIAKGGKPILVFKKKLKEGSKTAENTEESNNLEVKTTEKAMQLRATAGTNVIRNAPKFKVFKVRNAHEDGTKLQTKALEASKGLVTKQLKKIIKLKRSKIGSPVIESEV